MGDIFFSLRAFVSHWLNKEDRFSQQSPFVFQTYSGLRHFLNQNKKGNPEIEAFRASLLQDHEYIEVLDLGAGSKKVPQALRPISKITRYSTSNSKFAQLYQYFCGMTPAEYVLELGTCMGISTRYLDAQTRGKLFTFEGSEQIQKIAQRRPLPPKTNFILGPIEQTLPQTLQSIPKVDFALIDANHTYDGTISAFRAILPRLQPTSIVAIGDPHWTPGMERVWEEIKALPEVKLTLDFFECGIVFFDFPGEKSHLILDV
ncbi:class I SAM-dependent methyltransferase [Algoriphagus sp. H41]|uniref:Class I SAM-dependent methyltransferase n=1 Tax=Algoriphagus oliviformis TaxID=2811231 RepID=A0ABS3C957_9BACT|nr:class I SAM-dependent methyltransferase [Algoriphagus oliviformis]MBN7812701.1 class I SAM-dependent methyltransferase [Algoriphagus oliviformis]